MPILDSSDYSSLLTIRQLSFTLLDLMQLGDLRLNYDSVNKVHLPGHHEVHDPTGSQLLAAFNQFEISYAAMRKRLEGLEGYDDYQLQLSRGGSYADLKDLVNSPRAPNVLISPDNIHDVKVVLVGEFFTLSKGGSSCKCSAFRVLPPYMLPYGIAHENEFFAAITATNCVPAGPPSLSSWLVEKIEQDYHDAMKPSEADEEEEATANVPEGNKIVKERKVK